MDRDEGYALLARRFLEAYGPATPRDLAYWGKVTVTDAKRAFSGQDGLEEVATSRGPMWALPGTADPPDPGEPVVRLLPVWENYLLGYEDREPAVPRPHDRMPGAGKPRGHRRRALVRPLAHRSPETTRSRSWSSPSPPGSRRASGGAGGRGRGRRPLPRRRGAAGGRAPGPAELAHDQVGTENSRATPSTRSQVSGVCSRPKSPMRSMTTRGGQLAVTVAAATPPAPISSTSVERGEDVCSSQQAADQVVPARVGRARRRRPPCRSASRRPPAPRCQRRTRPGPRRIRRCSLPRPALIGACSASSPPTAAISSTATPLSIARCFQT